MGDEQPRVPAGRGDLQREKVMPMVVWGLYIASLLIGLTALVGVVLAYLYRPDAPAWARSHYQFAIRTFWGYLLGFVVGVLLLGIGVGALILIATVVWVVARSIAGIVQANSGTPIADPTSWALGR